MSQPPRVQPVSAGAAAGAAKTTQPRKISLENQPGYDATPQSNRYTIYDLKSVKREILTVFDAAENGDNRAITKFSKVKNFDVDAKDRYGRTALIWAADCGHLHSVETLIRLSANINNQDTHTGRTAIHWAARAGNLPIVKLLTRYGARCEQRDRFGRTPLHMAKSIGSAGEEVFQFLLRRLLHKKSLEHNQLLVQYGANYKKEDRFGLTPLYLAKSKGYEGEEVFKYLLGEGAPYNETKTIDVASIEAEIAAEMAKVEAKQAALAEPATLANSSSTS